MPHLHVICGEAKGSRHDLTTQEVACGRHSSNTIAVDDPVAADHHCVLSRTDRGYRLEVESTSRVGLNGQITRGAELRHGDILTIGSAELVYCTDTGEPHEGLEAKNRSPFEPASPTLSLLDRLFWPFAREARARRQLALAHQYPDDPKRTERVVGALHKLTRGKKSLGPTASALRTDMLLYLGWKALGRGETEKSSECLGLLDSSAAPSDAKAALRWDLMCVLWKVERRDAYVREAGLYLADDRAAIPSRANAVRDVIRFLYEGVSPKACAGVLGKAHKTLLEQAHVRAAHALCVCPEGFDKVSDAEQWTSQVPPEILAFSRVMAADAHLVAARAAETREEWDGMLDSALRALRLAPSHRPALYWLTRAKLHMTGADPTDHLGPNALSGDAAWDRLALLVSIHHSSNLATAAPARQMLEGKMGHCAEPEVLLLVELLRHVLETAPAASLPDIDAADGLCRAIENRVGELPWTRVPIAHRKIRLDREFRPAYELLEQREIIGQPRARHLARVARILAGSPLRPDSKSGNEALTAIERAMFQLFGPESANAAPDAIALLQSLYSCRSDAVFAEFPDLQSAVLVLALALRATAQDVRAVWPNLKAMTLAEPVPEWVRWLHARTVLLAGDYVASPQPLPGVINPAIGCVAWAVDCWARNQSRNEAKDHAGSNDVHAGLESWASGVTSTARPAVLAILAARNGAYRAFEGGDAHTEIASVHPDLGDLADAVCAAELRTEVRYAWARRAIWADKPADAAAGFASLDRGTDQLPAFAAMWWRPIVRYWLGVAYAHQGDGRAASILQGLLDGPRADDARGQLAMLALASGQDDQASQLLASASDLVPAVRYARALVLSRRGASPEALELLVSEEGADVFAGSSYDVPARRLAAAIEERDGRTEESDRLYSVILDSHPDDEVAGIRLGRRVLEQAYAHFRMERTIDASSIRDVGRTQIPKLRSAVSWWQACTLFHGLLTQSPDSLADLAENVELQVRDAAARWAWRQVIAARLLKGQRPDAAFRVLDAGAPAGAPGWFGRSRSILSAWRGLTSLPDDSARDEAVRHLSQSLRGFEELADADSTALEWRSLAELGMLLGTEMQPVPDERWARLTGTHMADIPFLFDADLERRRAAAESLLPALVAEASRWTEEQQLLLQALSAWAMGDDDTYVKQCGYLEPMLDELPIRGRDLWVPAALIRYSTGDWKSLTGDSLPDCLADMSDPLVCLVLELADARATVGDLKNPRQRLAQKINGIRNNLAALMERLDARESEAGSR